MRQLLRPSGYVWGVTRADIEPGPTLSHVALRAGVSKSTASMVLRGAPGPSKETADRVRRVAKELGYRTRVGASALRAGLGPTVALLLDPRTMDRRLMVDTFWAKLVNSVVLTCSAEAIPVLIAAGDDAEALQGRAVDSVFVMSDELGIDEFESLGFGLPIVKLEMGDEVDPRLTTTLRLDVDTCVRNVMDHLLAVGARQPAVIYGRERSLLGHVEDSYRRWCANSNIEPVVIENADPHDDERCVSEAASLIGDGVDAVFTYMTDPANVVRAGQVTGKQVPDEVALVAHGDRTSLPLTGLTLSNVSFCGMQAGEIAGHALMDAMGAVPEVEIDLPWLFTPRASSRG